LLVIAFWNRNDFSQDILFDPGLEREPIQKKVQIEAFDASFNGITYRIEPEYDYDLYGLVVSYRHHDGDSMLHKSWNDHLNMVDVCVVWQDSAFTPLLNKLDFWSGQFTCNVKTRDDAAWASFSMDQLSNNHLISDDPLIRDKVGDIKIGDQIRVQGWLSAYANTANLNKGSGKRGTSTVRTDTGNGACETIYVREFDIVRPANGGWRKLMYLSLSTYLAALAIFIWRPYRPHG
jgi:hypothetical protein